MNNKNKSSPGKLYANYKKIGRKYGFHYFEDFEKWVQSKKNTANLPFANLKQILKTK